MRQIVAVTVFMVIAALIPDRVNAQACGPYIDCFNGGDHRVSCPAGYGVINCHFDCGTFMVTVTRGVASHRSEARKRTSGTPFF